MVLKAERILWPTDFSSLSLHGGRCARALCEHFDAALHVVHVIPPLLPPDFLVTLPAEVPSESADDELLHACRGRLDALIDEQFAGLTRVAREVFFGHAWSGICHYAEKAAIDLIVVTTHGRTGLRHVLIGSTAERIVQHAPCPVLVVKNPAGDFGS